MKRIAFKVLFSFVAVLPYAASSWRRVNQIGYLANDIKVGVWISNGNH